MSTANRVGIGLRHPHYLQVLAEKPSIDWLEVHTENFMLAGGPLWDFLHSIRQHYPLSFHGVGLSLGSATGVRKSHLKRIKKLSEEFSPFLLSEHLSWNTLGRTYLPDLFPIPYNDEALHIFSENIDKAQNYLQRTLLIENPSTYVEYQHSTYSEPEFLNTLIKQTGAKLLLDINNIFVSCSNHGWDAQKYLQAIAPDTVAEIHLAGHSIKELPDQQYLRIDTHDNKVCDEVWELYAIAIKRFGPVPTLLEWDKDLPPLDVLIKEAKKAYEYY